MPQMEGDVVRAFIPKDTAVNMHNSTSALRIIFVSYFSLSQKNIQRDKTVLYTYTCVHTNLQLNTHTNTHPYSYTHTHLQLPANTQAMVTHRLLQSIYTLLDFAAIFSLLFLLDLYVILVSVLPPPADKSIFCLFYNISIPSSTISTTLIVLRSSSKVQLCVKEDQFKYPEHPIRNSSNMIYCACIHSWHFNRKVCRQH